MCVCVYFCKRNWIFRVIGKKTLTHSRHIRRYCNTMNWYETMRASMNTYILMIRWWQSEKANEKEEEDQKKEQFAQTKKKPTEKASNIHAARSHRYQWRKVFYLSVFIIGIKPANKIVYCVNSEFFFSFSLSLSFDTKCACGISMMISNWLGRLLIKISKMDKESETEEEENTQNNKKKTGHFIISKAVILFEIIRFESIYFEMLLTFYRSNLMEKH